MPDLETVLRSAKTTDAVRADAWDIVSKASSSDELAANLRKLPLTNAVRAELWDVRFGAPEAAPGFLDNIGRNLSDLASGAKALVTDPVGTLSAARRADDAAHTRYRSDVMAAKSPEEQAEIEGGRYDLARMPADAARFAYERPVDTAIQLIPGARPVANATGRLTTKLGEVAAHNARFVKAATPAAKRLATRIIPGVGPVRAFVREVRGVKANLDKAKAPSVQPVPFNAAPKKTVDPMAARMSKAEDLAASRRMVDSLPKQPQPPAPPAVAPAPSRTGTAWAPGEIPRPTSVPRGTPAAEAPPAAPVAPPKTRFKHGDPDAPAWLMEDAKPGDFRVLSGAQIGSRLGVEAKRAGVKLTPKQSAEATELVKAGAEPAAAVREVAALDAQAELMKMPGVVTPAQAAAEVTSRPWYIQYPRKK